MPIWFVRTALFILINLMNPLVHAQNAEGSELSINLEKILEESKENSIVMYDDKLDRTGLFIVARPFDDEGRLQFEFCELLLGQESRCRDIGVPVTMQSLYELKSQVEEEKSETTKPALIQYGIEGAVAYAGLVFLCGITKNTCVTATQFFSRYFFSVGVTHASFMKYGEYLEKNGKELPSRKVSRLKTSLKFIENLNSIENSQGMLFIEVDNVDKASLILSDFFVEYFSSAAEEE